jgi:MFS family permease
MAYPIMPLFIVGILKAPRFYLGLIEGVALALVNFMRGWSGFHSDKTGRRVPYIQWGYLTSGLSKPIIGLAYVWPTVLGARVLDRFGKGLRTTARDAMLADSVDAKEYGRAYGLHQGMDTAGAFVGVIFTLVLLWLLHEALSPEQVYRRIFMIAAVPGFIAWVITFTLKELPRPKTEERPSGEAEGFRWDMLGGGFWRAVLISSVFALANSSDTFIMLRAHDIGLSDYLVVIAYALYNLVFSFISLPFGKLSDKFGRWGALGAGWILYAAVYFGFGIANTVSIWVLFAVYGISIGAITGVNKALVADVAPKRFRGTAMGIFQMATGVATLVANPAVGWVWDRFGAAAAFNLGAGLAVLAVLLIPLTRSMERKRQAVPSA